MAWLGTRPRAVWVAATAALTLGAVLVVVARGPVPRREPVVAQEFALGSQWADSVERVLARQSPRDMDPGAVMSARNGALQSTEAAQGTSGPRPPT